MNQQHESFGIIPLRREKDVWEVFLIRHRFSNYWGFPKGHAESNETSKSAACRELKEETNLDIVRFLQEEPMIEQYQFILNKQKVSKKVYYYIAEVSGEVFLQQKEISDGIWLPLSQAFEKVTHLEGKTILSQVEKILSKIQ